MGRRYISHDERQLDSIQHPIWDDLEVSREISPPPYGVRSVDGTPKLRDHCSCKRCIWVEECRSAVSQGGQAHCETQVVVWAGDTEVPL